MCTVSLLEIVKYRSFSFLGVCPNITREMTCEWHFISAPMRKPRHLDAVYAALLLKIRIENQRLSRKIEGNFGGTSGPGSGVDGCLLIRVLR